jgi:hypothetical protein
MLSMLLGRAELERDIGWAGQGEADASAGLNF